MKYNMYKKNIILCTEGNYILSIDSISMYILHYKCEYFQHSQHELQMQYFYISFHIYIHILFSTINHIFILGAFYRLAPFMAWVKNHLSHPPFTFIQAPNSLFTTALLRLDYCTFMQGGSRWWVSFHFYMHWHWNTLSYQDTFGPMFIGEQRHFLTLNSVHLAIFHVKETWHMTHTVLVWHVVLP